MWATATHTRQRRRAMPFMQVLPDQGMNYTFKKQDVLLTEGEQDHLFSVEWLYRAMRELVCARSVTARIFTSREGAEQHCQLGNSAVAREEIVRWLSRFHPEIREHRLSAAG